MTRAKSSLLLLLLTTACDPQALQRREAADAALVGSSEADLVRSLGVPARTVEANGHRFLAYDETRTSIEPPLYPFHPWAYGLGYGGDFPPRIVQFVCETTFEVTAGRVVGFVLRGNACG